MRMTIIDGGFEAMKDKDVIALSKIGPKTERGNFMEGDFGAWHVSENEKRIVRNFEILEKRMENKLLLELNQIKAYVDAKFQEIEDRIGDLEKAMFHPESLET